MSAVELMELYENLSLADKDGAVLEISEEAQMEGKEDVYRCFVGKVLARKKVSREAFKALIDQLWSPFGSVEIELIGDNTFMFYFVNPEERDRFWQRGSWHFGKSLIVLEKPEGSGDVSRLGFQGVEFWIQIHDIPIICMNRRIARWLAEQIGRVIEIPADSRECWGKFMRVKVQLDITKPLKQWLRLKLDKSENIVVVALKYERLPDFCYACGRIGHITKDCTDEEAKKMALDGLTTKYGLWLKAHVPEKMRSRFQGPFSGSSLDRDRPGEKEPEVSGNRSLSSRPGSLVSQNVESEKAVTVARKETAEAYSETLIPVKGLGPSQPEKMVLDGPRAGPESASMEVGGQNVDPCFRGIKDQEGENEKETVLVGVEVRPKKLNQSPALKRLLKKHSLEMVFLSEMKIRGNKRDRFRNFLGYAGCFGVDSIGSSIGLLLLWKDSVDISILSFSKGHIDARVR
ncbi:hypothetical protein Dsin_005607 [Dipteronia sinensis]|uniref:CCHC-type domain-containing protein n=1 Tax=Dipteronia sinensis TaxID=43782 RepID=A0AAE0EGN2_9ROSI|nr:hypothetical protein Dsin_005607 [Dipteronia sinensis]